MEPRQPIITILPPNAIKVERSFSKNLIKINTKRNKYFGMKIY